MAGNSSDVNEIVNPIDAPNNPTPDTPGTQGSQQTIHISVETGETIKEAATADSSKKRKGMRPRSVVWDHFTKFTDNDGNIKGKCKYCSKDFFCDPRKNGTSALIGHMSKCTQHPHTVDTHQTQIVMNSGLSKVDDTTLSTWRFDQELIMHALAKMIIMDEQPFKFVEHEGFRYFMSVCCPRFKIPSRWTVARDCFDMYVVEVEKLKLIFKNTCQRVSLTTDTWTSIQRINYMCLTVHFIDNDWILHKKIINFCPIVSHKGEGICLALEKCLKSWEIEKVFTVTVDNASSNDVAMGHFKKRISKWDATIANGEHVHIRCVAHILNLIVVEGLKDLSESVVRVRQVVRYVRQSPARINKFKQCCEAEKIECKRELCLDVPTRWNSTYLMLSVAEKFKRGFDRFHEFDPYFKIEFESHVWVDKIGCNGELTFDSNGNVEKEMKIIDERPNSDDWEHVRHFSGLLEDFYTLTLRISGSSYITCNSMFGEISVIYAKLKGWSESDDLELISMGSRMKSKFEKYWGDPAKMNKLIYIATILDPRHKYGFVEYVLCEMYGGDVGESVAKKVKDLFFSLFEEYKHKFEGDGGESSDNSTMTERSSSMNDNVGVQIWSKKYKQHKLARSSTQVLRRSEVDKYLNEEDEGDSEDFNMLKWWKRNGVRYPILATMARDVLAVPISTVASESAFSTRGRVLDPFRSSLTPKVVKSLICTQDWLRISNEPINVEETIEDVQNLDENLTNINVGSAKFDI